MGSEMCIRDSNESGAKAVILPFDTVTSATISVGTMYDIGLAQPNRKSKAREARRFLRLYVYIYVHQGVKWMVKCCAGAHFPRKFRFFHEP